MHLSFRCRDHPAAKETWPHDDAYGAFWRRDVEKGTVTDAYPGRYEHQNHSEEKDTMTHELSAHGFERTVVNATREQNETGLLWGWDSSGCHVLRGFSLIPNDVPRAAYINDYRDTGKQKNGELIECKS